MEYGRWTVNALPQWAGQGELKPGSREEVVGYGLREPRAVVIIASEWGLSRME